VDKELERRGHAFVRCADDANVYVRSRKTGERVMRLLRKLYGRLRLTINPKFRDFQRTIPLRFNHLRVNRALRY
jgi:retron-type reverse transcriptase